MAHYPLSRQRQCHILPREFPGRIGGKSVDATGGQLYTPRVLFVDEDWSCAHAGFSPDNNPREDCPQEDVKHQFQSASSVGIPAVASRLETSARMPGALLPGNVGGNVNGHDLADSSAPMHSRVLTANFFFSARPNTECDNDLPARQTPRTSLTTLRKRPAVIAPVKVH